MHIKIIIFITMLFSLTPFTCYAESISETDEYSQVYDISGADELYSSLDDDTQNLMKQAGITSAKLPAENSKDGIISAVRELLIEKLSAPGKTALLILAAIIICRICGCMENKSIGETAETVGALACAGSLLPHIIQMIAGLDTLALSSSVLLTSSVPVYSGLMIASGNAQTAMSHGAMSLAAGNLIPILAKGFILPAINILLAFSVVSTVSSLDLSKLINGIYSFIKWALILVTTLFFALIATQTAINTQLDEAAAKTAKLVISSAIPVVGGAIGDSLSAIQGGIDIVKSGVGAFGILASVFTVLPAAIDTVLWIAVCFAGQIAADLLECKSISGFLTACLAVLKMLLAVLVIICIVCIVCASIVIMGGKK